MTDDKQTEQPANENERRSEDELWKEFPSVSFYNMLRSVAGLAILVQPIPADQTEGSTKSDNPFDLAHYAGMQAWKQRSDDVRKLDYMKILLAELNKRVWSHEEKMTLLWFIGGVMHIENENIWNDGGQVHAAYPLRFAARTRAIDSAKPPACFRRTNGKSVRLVACLWEEELEKRKEAGDMYVSLMERKGIEKGIARGIALNQIQMARKMLVAGEPDDKILAYAEITPEQLEKIRREDHPTAH